MTQARIIITVSIGSAETEHDEAATKDAARTKRQEKRLAAMSPEMQTLALQYGLTTIEQFLACGVSRYRHIRHLIETSIVAGNRIRKAEEEVLTPEVEA